MWRREFEVLDSEIKTKVISGFPATGKSYFFNQDKNMSILDSDSSEFSWIKDKDGNNTTERNPDFPNNYMKHIKENIGKVDIIFVSSHKNVRDALKNNKIDYIIAYPNKTLKHEYIVRYAIRGNDGKFIEFIDRNWDNFIEDIEKETFPLKLELQEGEFLSDILTKLYCYKKTVSVM